MFNFDQIFPLNNLTRNESLLTNFEEATILGNLGLPHKTIEELSKKRKCNAIKSDISTGQINGQIVKFTSSSPSSPVEHSNSTSESDNFLPPLKRSKGNKEKKRYRRIAAQIEREFVCFVDGCSKAYGTEGALKMHIRLKHPDVSIPARDELYMRCQAAKASLQDLHIGVGLPWAVTAERLMAITPLTDSKTFPDNYTIPLQVVKLGAWQKSSQSNWNIVGTFSFVEHKFMWKFSSDKLLLKIEIPFSSVEGIAIEKLPDGSIALGLAVNDRPIFSRLIMGEGLNKPSMWAPCADFTGGCALSAKLHCLLFSKDRFPPALHAHFLRDSSTRGFLQRTLPISEQPEFLLFTLESCSTVTHSDSSLVSVGGTPISSNSSDLSSSISPSSLSPSSLEEEGSPMKKFATNALSFSNSLSSFPFSEMNPANFSECAIFHRKLILSFPLNQSIALNCCQANLILKQLLNPYVCSCGFVYFYSFCTKRVVRSDNWVHCTECNKCTFINSEHCVECGACVQDVCVQCMKWDSLVQEFSYP